MALYSSINEIHTDARVIVGSFWRLEFESVTPKRETGVREPGRVGASGPQPQLSVNFLNLTFESNSSSTSKHEYRCVSMYLSLIHI